MNINEESLALFQRLASSESGFVFDPVSGQSYTVNETGLALLRLLQNNNRYSVHSGYSS